MLCWLAACVSEAPAPVAPIVDARTLALPATAPALPEPPPANVLLVVLDDVGVDKIPSYGAHPDQPVLPVIDGLAARGVRFAQVWAHPVCSPTRAAILTGRHARRTGVGGTVDSTNNDYLLPQEEVLLPEALRRSPWAWETALLGKWHLDDDNTLAWPDRVFAQGFDHFRGTRGNLTIAPVVPADDVVYGYDYYELFDGDALAMTTAYPTTATVDDALALIPTLSEPWLVVLALHAPHKPFHDPPAPLLNTPLPLAPEPWQQFNAALEAADTELGRLLDALDPSRTTVFVLGDNGTPTEAIRPPFDPARDKGTLFEGGIRVPLVVAGPQVAAGATSDALVSDTDLFATVLDLAGVRASEVVWEDGAPPTWFGPGDGRTGPVPIDGLSLLPQLVDPATPGPRAQLFTERFMSNGGPPYTWRDQHAVRDERYKVVLDPLNGEVSAFALAPGALDEGEDLLLSAPSDAVLAELVRLTVALQDQVEALPYDH